MTYLNYVCDAVVIAVLLFFCLRGRKKGLVLTLCSLLAFFVALIGARAAADAFTPAVSDALQPRFAALIEQSLPAGGETAAASSSQEGGAIDSILRSAGLSGGIGRTLTKRILEQTAKTMGGVSSALSRALADTVARVLVFCVSFLAILIIWSLLSRALDLAARLPVIHTLNRFFGGLIGLAEGMLILFLAIRLIGGVIPQETVEKTFLLRFFFQSNPIKLLTEI